MITQKPIPDGDGWSPIPNSTARDRRISRRALGLLVEMLSYPSGWSMSADSLTELGSEGRDAMRGAMKELVTAGYVVHLKYCDELRKQKTASFAGTTPDVAGALADQWLSERPGIKVRDSRDDRPTDDSQTATSPRRTGFQASENQASGFQASARQASENQASYKEGRKTDQRRSKDKSAEDGPENLSVSGADLSSAELSERDPRDRERDVSEQLAGLDREGLEGIAYRLIPDHRETLARDVKSAATEQGVTFPTGHASIGDLSDGLLRRALVLTLLFLEGPDGIGADALGKLIL